MHGIFPLEPNPIAALYCPRGHPAVHAACRRKEKAGPQTKKGPPQIPRPNTPTPRTQGVAPGHPPILGASSDRSTLKSSSNSPLWIEERIFLSRLQEFNCSDARDAQLNVEEEKERAPERGGERPRSAQRRGRKKGWTRYGVKTVPI